MKNIALSFLEERIKNDKIANIRTSSYAQLAKIIQDYADLSIKIIKTIEYDNKGSYESINWEMCYYCRDGYSSGYSIVKIDGVERVVPTCKDHEV